MAGEERLFERPESLRQSGELDMPGDDVAEARIRDLYFGMPERLRAEGVDWYFGAHKIVTAIAEQYAALHPDIPLDAHRVAAIAAALSPQSSWRKNVRSVHALLGEGRVMTSQKHAEPALLILGGADPVSVLFDPNRTNWKVRSFFSNIARPRTSTAVTIDRHAWGILFGDARAIKRSGLRITEPEYRWAEERYRAVAEHLDILPHQLQAATWLAWKPEFAGDRNPTTDTDRQPELFPKDHRTRAGEIAPHLGPIAVAD